MDKLDIKLWTLASKGQIVPDRSLLKTPEQIEMIKKSAELNTAREFDTLKSKKVLQSLEIGLFFCQIFIFII